MGRAPCCDKANVKKGPWSPEEDTKLKAYIEKYGTGGNWIALPHKIGLKRCGKSCRLRWLNYLRPNIKHGGFSEEEDNIICNLYISIGSRWSIIAAQLPGRTDNDIKNYWNTKLKKKLLGRRKQSNINNRLSSSSNQDVNGANVVDDNQFSQGLSNSAMERLQLHMQLQGLQNPFSFYNNPALWPKVHPFIQASDVNPNLLMQTFLQNPQPQNDQQSGAQAQPDNNFYDQQQQDYPKITNNKGLDLEGICSPPDGAVPFISHHQHGIEQSNATVEPVSNFQAELDELLNNKTEAGYAPQEDQMGSNQFDCFKEMNGSKDSFMWWSTDFDAKSASSNSWDSTPAGLQSNGMFQDYELGYNM